jgi:hypothetical protein
MEYTICKSKILTLIAKETMFKKVSHTYLRAKWSVQDFAGNLSLPYFGLDAHKGIPLPLFLL